MVAVEATHLSVSEEQAAAVTKTAYRVLLQAAYMPAQVELAVLKVLQAMAGSALRIPPMVPG